MLENGILFPDPTERQLQHYVAPPLNRERLSPCTRALGEAAADLQACYLRCSPTPWVRSQKRIEEKLDGVLDNRSASISEWVLARTLRAATPLFMLPNAHIALEDVEAGLTGVQTNYIETIDALDALFASTPRSHTERINTLVGKMNELCVLAALTSPEALHQKGLLALPSLPWEDAPGLFQLKSAEDDKLLAFDIKLVPFPNLPNGPTETTYVQVKTSHFQQKVYADHIKLVYGSILSTRLGGQLPELRAGHKPRHLHDAILRPEPCDQTTVFKALFQVLFETL